jgi:hypothetical protein
VELGYYFNLLFPLYQGNDACKGGGPLFFPRLVVVGAEAAEVALLGGRECRPLLISARVGLKPTVGDVEALAPVASDRLGGYRVLSRADLSDYSLDAGVLFFMRLHLPL